MGILDHRTTSPLLALALAGGCTGDSRSADEQGGASGISAGTGIGAGTDTTEGTTSAQDDGPGGGTLRLDMPEDSANDPGGGGDGQAGCDKVDFLFVIDNSGSMQDEQAHLIQSFPKFIDTIKTTLDAAQDYHIMVADTDAWVFERCEQACSPFGPPGCDNYTCGQTTAAECEDVVGAGVIEPRGSQASNRDCNFSSGARYMDSSEPDLEGAFACAAQVGIGSTGRMELPMEAMVAATSSMGPAATCNSGFLRDDAILVVTFITDENDDAGDGSAGTVESWHQALIDAKNGDASAVVVLGLYGDTGRPNAICQPLDPFNPFNTGGAEASPRLDEFVASWGDHGFSGSVCADSYESFFADAVGIIDTTCDEFIPPAG